MNQKELFEMGLHEIKNIAQGFTVMRVLGGWIYYTYSYDGGEESTACFVPEPPSVLADFPEVDEYVDPFADFLEIIRKEKKDVTPDHIADTGKKVRDDNHVGSCEEDMIPIVLKKREPLSKLRFLAKQMSEEKISHLWAADYLKEIIEEMEAA